MIDLANWAGGYSLVGDIDNYTELYVAYGEDEIPADNLYWDFEPEADDTERRVQFRDLLSNLTSNVQVVDTDTLTGIAFDITEEFDWSEDGRARGLYRLKSEDNGETYAANASDFTRLVKLMTEYTEEVESDDDSETGS